MAVVITLWVVGLTVLFGVFFFLGVMSMLLDFPTALWNAYRIVSIITVSWFSIGIIGGGIALGALFII